MVSSTMAKIVLENGISLPEGALVVVSVPKSNLPEKKERLRLPLVPSHSPGSVDLTNEQIAEVLGQEDVPMRH